MFDVIGVVDVIHAIDTIQFSKGPPFVLFEFFALIDMIHVM